MVVTLGICETWTENLIKQYEQLDNLIDELNRGRDTDLLVYLRWKVQVITKEWELTVPGLKPKGTEDPHDNPYPCSVIT